MNKKIILIWFILSFYVSANQVYACSIVATQYFYIKTENLNCLFTSYNENISSNIDVIEFINNRTPSYTNCANLTLSENEQKIFKNVINQFNKQSYVFASVHLEKQSDEEYATFQNVISKVNDDKCDCQRYNNITRYGTWTIYVKAMDCPFDSACRPIPPEGCFNRFTYDIFNIFSYIILFVLFLVVPFGVIIGIVFLIRSIIKKSKK